MSTTTDPPTPTPPPVPPPVGGPDRDDSGSGGSAHRRIAGATAVMMTGILGSRVLGLVRDRLIAHQYGQGFKTDTYNAAFMIPDLIFFLIAGGAFSSAFIPVFTEYIATGREREAWRIFSVVASVMAIAITGFILIGEIWARPLVALTNPGYVNFPGKIEATVTLTRILLPAQLCFFLGGLMMGTLNARGNFTGQAFGPVIYNLGIILGCIFLTPHLDVAGLCWGAVGGAIIGNLLLQWVLVRRSGGYFLPGALREYWRHPGVRKVWILLLPVIFGLALPQVSTIIGRSFASIFSRGAQSALMNANRLMQVPLGVFAQATAVAIFPTMAAQAARKEIPQLRNSVNFGIRSILFLTVPSSLLMYVLALPIVQLILQSGAFTQKDSELTADVLRFFAIGIFAWSAHAIITRGFYALQDSRTPVVVGTLVTGIFIPMNWPLRHWLGVSGLALATSIAAIIHMVSLLLLLRRRLRGLNGGRLLLSLTRITVASAIAALVCCLVRDRIQAHFAAQALEQVQRHGAVIATQMAHRAVTKHALELLTACLGVSAAVYGGLALLLRMEEVQVVQRMIRRRRLARS